MIASTLPHPAAKPAAAAPWAGQCLRWAIGLLLALVAAMSGCTRSFYRREADFEVAQLLAAKQNDPRWQLPDYRIYPSPAARYFDPFCPDRPPMTLDDPASHRLMHCVDGKRQWPGWDRQGCSPHVENPRWPSVLPRDEGGRVPLDRRSAVQLALVNSREYQRAREELYLSALDVSLQRFRFDAIFFGRHSTYFEATGPDRAGGDRSELALNRDVGRALELRKRLATGGELVAGLANELVWQFAGPDQYSAVSVLDFSLIQPLLRSGGRAVALEGLTLAERNLLANVRQMARFHQTFYTQVLTGRTTGPSPSRGRLGFDPGPSGIGGGGLFALLAEQVRIRNQRMNVVGLRDNLDRLEELHAAGRIDRFQVDLARQALYNAQSGLLDLTKAHEDRLDAYKVLLGLPPDLPMQLDDDLLAPLNLIDPDLIAAKELADSLIRRLRDPAAAPKPGEYAGALAPVGSATRAQLAAVRADFQKLLQALPRRRRGLEQLARRPQFVQGEVDPGAYDAALLNRRVIRLARELEGNAYAETLAVRLGSASRSATWGEPEIADETLSEPLATRLKKTLEQLDQLARSDGAAMGQAASALHDELVDRVSELSSQLLQLQLVQALARLDTITLVPVQLDPREAIEIARDNRLDWMNARAALVDQWRQIKLAANDLRSRVDVRFSGDMSTVGNNPTEFRATTGQLRVGLEVDSPINRVAERNAYREALIAYQRARRDYMAFQDRVYQGLRSELRAIENAQLDFELRRVAVRVAISQVDVTQERLREPPKVGETIKPLGPTAARDLVQSYSGLLNAQNGLLAAWVEYESLRLALDLDLGTMRLDAENQWIDPGPIGQDESTAEADDAGAARAPDPPELVPLPPPDPPAPPVGAPGPEQLAP